MHAVLHLVRVFDQRETIFFFAASLNAHLSNHSVEYIQFAFRWMNNLLMREFPLRCVIRLWDSYLVSQSGTAFTTLKRKDAHSECTCRGGYSSWETAS